MKKDDKMKQKNATSTRSFGTSSKSSGAGAGKESGGAKRKGTTAGSGKSSAGKPNGFFNNNKKSAASGADKGFGVKSLSSAASAGRSSNTGKSSKKSLHKGETSSKTPKNKSRGAKSVSGDLIQGVLDVSSKGFGFVRVEGFDEDVFIPAGSMNGAMNKDTVSVRLVSNHRGGGEGEICEILKRGYERIVCTFKNTGGFCYAVPDDTKFCSDISIVKGSERTAADGDKVVVLITSYGRRISGEVLEVLGRGDEPSVAMMSIIRSYGLYETFPKGVLGELKTIPDEVLPEEKNGRADYTDDLIITIDGEDSRDFDDAVNLTRTDDGLYVLSVHIADVSHYVKWGSKLDVEAYKRGTSVYFPDLVLPMLPPKLSNSICSLNEGVERLTLSCIMTIDKDGNIIKHKIKESVIRSSHRMTYNQTAKILDGDKELCEQFKHLVPMLNDMKTLSQILTNKRVKRGAIDFDLTESEIVLDERGKVCDVRKKYRLITHRLIEEFMLAANETVAAYMCSMNAPLIFRAHEPPPSIKIETLEDFLSAIGYQVRFTEKPTPAEFALLLKNAPPELSPVISRVTLRSMSKATYEPVNKAHFGLAAEFYCHFTSPIRRYPDLIVHRILKDFLQNGKKCFKKYEEFTAAAAEESSVKERAAEKAERDVDDLKKAEYLSGKIGEIFDGIISGVTEWGFYVELENSCEGFIKAESLDGYYTYNQRTMSLSNSAITYRIGDKVKIKVEGINYNKVDFSLIERLA